MNEKFLIEYKGEFFWNGRFKRKNDPPDPKLYWTNNFLLAGKMDTFNEASKIQSKYFNYPTRVVKTIFDADGD
jgi:hypothetical protein